MPWWMQYSRVYVCSLYELSRGLPDDNYRYWAGFDLKRDKDNMLGLLPVQIHIFNLWNALKFAKKCSCVIRIN
jgi:hypothetical protein